MYKINDPATLNFKNKHETEAMIHQQPVQRSKCQFTKKRVIAKVQPIIF